MFDNYRVAPAYPQSVEVTERKAPTDESIRLVREFEEAAWKRVLEVASVQLPDIQVEAVAVTEGYPSAFGNRIHIIFKLNGKRVDIEIDKPHYLSNPEGFIRALVDGLSKRIAVQLMEHALRSGTVKPMGKL